MYKNFLYYVLFFNSACMCMTNEEIVPFQSHYRDEALSLIYNTIFELQIAPCSSVDEIRERCIKKGIFNDLDDVESHYTNNKGAFFVMIAKGAIIGAGGFSFLEPSVCELKRLFFAKEYRGKGLGKKMLSFIIQKAQEYEYSLMRLAVFNPEVQVSAINLYKKFGFYERESYCETGNCKFFMEKKL